MWFLRRSPKCLSQSESMVTIKEFLISRIFRTTIGTFVENLVILLVLILEKKSKIVSANHSPWQPSFHSQQIVATLPWDYKRNIFGKFGVHPYCGSWDVENVSANQSPWQPSWNFLSQQKVMKLLQGNKRNIYGKFGDCPCSGSWRTSRICLSQSEFKVAIVEVQSQQKIITLLQDH